MPALLLKLLPLIAGFAGERGIQALLGKLAGKGGTLGKVASNPATQIAGSLGGFIGGEAVASQFVPQSANAAQQTQLPLNIAQASQRDTSAANMLAFQDQLQMEAENGNLQPMLDQIGGF